MKAFWKSESVCQVHHTERKFLVSGKTKRIPCFSRKLALSRDSWNSADESAQGHSFANPRLLAINRKPVSNDTADISTGNKDRLAEIVLGYVLSLPVVTGGGVGAGVVTGGGVGAAVVTGGGVGAAVVAGAGVGAAVGA